MTSSRGFSAQTLSVLAALCDEPSQWQHGYALAKQTGLRSGTLYPILIRLADRKLLETRWETPPPGRPARHLYRLTSAGLELAATLVPAPAAQEGRPATSRPSANQPTAPRSPLRPSPPRPQLDGT